MNPAYSANSGLILVTPVRACQRMAGNISYFSINDQLRAPGFTGALEGVDARDMGAIDGILSAAAEFANVPVSGFRVGALAVGTSGRSYLGANLEFTGVPLSTTLHAEQSAVINAWLHGEQKIRSLHVSEPPCGHCLQFLQELGEIDDPPIHAGNMANKLTELLPSPFILAPGRNKGLLGSEEQELISVHPSEDSLVVNALEAARRSYTPYTGSAEGFIIQTMQGHIFEGRSLESGAFNPSVPAVVVALNQRNLSNHREDTISRCVHSKLATAVNHTLAISEAIFRAISSVKIECHLIEEK